MDPLLLAATKSPVRYIAGVMVAQAFSLAGMMVIVVTQPPYHIAFAVFAVPSWLGVAACYSVHRSIFDETEKLAFPTSAIIFCVGTAATLASIAYPLVVRAQSTPDAMQKLLWMLAMVTSGVAAFSASITLAPLIAYWNSVRHRKSG